MKELDRLMISAVLAVLIMLAASPSGAQPLTGAPGAPPKYAPDVPAKITTPDTVQTRIGTRRFKDRDP
jgi:hypothetical protein